MEKFRIYLSYDIEAEDIHKAEIEAENGADILEEELQLKVDATARGI